MDIKLIGQYIQFLRKKQGISQKELAERLGLSNQAVSKWETGENLPDASLLLDLADILGTTTDGILRAGEPVRKREKINIEKLREGIRAIDTIKDAFGEKSSLYLGVIEGIQSRVNLDVNVGIESKEGRELLLCEVVMQCLLNGYYIDDVSVEENFESEDVKKKIRDCVKSCSLFKGKASVYDEYRPSYPSEVVDLIFSLVKDPIIADIGSGTGKMSALCVSRAKKLYAVEPNNQMRKVADSLMSPYPNYVSITASAESTRLADSSIDVIIAAEAYQWFDNNEAKAEFRRILKPDGYVVLIWNVFGGDEYDAEKHAIEDIWRKKLNVISKNNKEQRAINLFGKGRYQKLEIDNSRYQSKEEFCGGLSSVSFAPQKGTYEYSKFLKQISDLFEKYSKNGKIKTTIKTVCFFGKLG